MDRTKSDQLHTEALSHLVGGVNSPVRAFKSVHGNPIYFEKASGAHVTDVDGNVLVDFVQSWGPLIHGHSHPEIIEAVHEKMLNGTSFGAPHLGEIELAKRVKQRFPHMDKVRFVSSGTEAVMSAVRLARGYTGRDILVKFEGCYHGHVDSLMVSSGSGLATFGIASSPGIPHDTVATTLICPLDDLEAVEYLFNEHGSEIAAVVIEPLPANNGLLVQRPEFLHGLRTLCDQHGALLIFDEVISGFRFQEGSYGDLCGVTPDLTALGKVIGGGLPVGAYGARSEIMEHLSPLGPVYQAGTLSGNPLAMAAGIASLKLLRESMPYEKLEQLGSQLAQGVAEIAREHSIPLQVPQIGSMYCLFFSENPVRNYEDALSSDAEIFKKLFQHCLKNGVYLPPSAYETCFISTSHSSDNISMTLDCFQSAFRSF